FAAQQITMAAQAIAPRSYESVTAGSAYSAAACPVSTKVPAPMMPPTPNATRLSADSVRLRGRTSASSFAWDASATSSSTDFLAQISVKIQAFGNVRSADGQNPRLKAPQDN